MEKQERCQDLICHTSTCAFEQSGHHMGLISIYGKGGTLLMITVDPTSTDPKEWFPPWDHGHQEKKGVSWFSNSVVHMLSTTKIEFCVCLCNAHSCGNSGVYIDCQLLSTLLSEVGTLTELRAHLFGNTGWPAGPRDLLPRHWDDRHVPLCLALKKTWVLGDWTWLFTFMLQVLYQLGHPPAPEKGPVGLNDCTGWVLSGDGGGAGWPGSHMAWELRGYFHLL